MNTSIETKRPATDSADDIDRVVFFDGVCGMCNHTVDFLMARDPHARLKFAPLQGETASKTVSEGVRGKLDTFVFLQNRQTYLRTAALVRILWVLGGFWRLMGTLLWLIPSPLRNLGYRFVAKIRYRIAGRKESCRMPTPEERARFLD